jgi:hypothetical protein
VGVALHAPEAVHSHRDDADPHARKVVVTASMSPDFGLAQNRADGLDLHGASATLGW